MDRKRMIQPAREAPVAAEHDEAERRGLQRRDTPPANSIEAVRLVDLSTHGCCLGFAKAVDYRPGQFIRLGFSGEKDAVRAIVRWIKDERIGAEFTSDLADAQVEAILDEGRSPVVGLL
jgi:hypothetical protein